jgi:hypothetical protein
MHASAAVAGVGQRVLTQKPAESVLASFTIVELLWFRDQHRHDLLDTRCFRSITSHGLPTAHAGRLGAHDVAEAGSPSSGDPGEIFSVRRWRSGLRRRPTAVR